MRWPNICGTLRNVFITKRVVKSLKNKTCSECLSTVLLKQHIIRIYNLQRVCRYLYFINFKYRVEFNVTASPLKIKAKLQPKQLFSHCKEAFYIKIGFRRNQESKNVFNDSIIEMEVSFIGEPYGIC